MKSLITCILLFSLVSSLSATSYLNHLEASIVDGRSNALGGTAVLATENAFVVFNNPALMTLLPGATAACNIEVRAGSSESEYCETTDWGSVTYADFEEIDATYKLRMKINGIALASPYTLSEDLKIAFGCGWHTYLDRSYTCEEEYHSYDEEINRQRISVSQTTTSSGGFQVVSGALGGVYRNNLSLGCSVNFPMLLSSSKVVYENLFEEEELEYSFTGMYFMISGVYTLLEKCTLAIRYRPAFNLKIEQESTTDYTSPYSIEYRIPEELVFAASVNPHEDITIWAEFKNLHLNQCSYTRDDMVIQDWRSENGGTCVRFGLEYRDNVKYRIGFWRQDTPQMEPASSEGWIWSEEELTTETGFAIGLGVNVTNKAVLDIYSSFSMNKNEWDRLNDNPTRRYEEINYCYTLGMSLSIF